MKVLAPWPLAIALVAGPSIAQPFRPELVCDFSNVSVRILQGGMLRPFLEAGPLRLTFRDIDRQAGTAKAIMGDGGSGAQGATVTADATATTYLVERPGGSKLVVTTGNKATAEGWPAMMSQHGSSGDELTMGTAAGWCRMRSR